MIFRDISAPELWLPDYATIVVSNRLRSAQQREVCAHGVAHAALGHEDDRPKHENQADLYSSLYLIDPFELAQIMGDSNDLGRASTELGLTTQLLGTYLQWAS